MVHFLFSEPKVPAKEDLIPKKLDEAKTKEVLETALEFVARLPEMNHEESENAAKEYAEKLGVKLGDFMMPIRMAVTGSRVSPPLIGSILILGVEESINRIKNTIAAF
jgi:glutamyl-tRNA synthetase